MKLTGYVYADADGHGRGRYFSNYTVHIVRWIDGNHSHPILLGDAYSEQLGWVRPFDLSDTCF